MIKRVLTWGLVILLIFYVVQNPARAGQQANSIGGALIYAANSFSTFFANLIG